MRSAVVLAGGQGRRIGGKKPLVRLGTATLLERTVTALAGAVDEVIIVARDRAQAEVLRSLVPCARVAWDRTEGFGPVAGLMAGMRAAGGEYAFACGCDHPFLNVEVVDELFELVVGKDASVPVFRGFAERLHAVYRSGKMAKACEESLERGERKIAEPLSRIKVNYVDVLRFRALDPENLTFFNVNTREDLRAAEEILRLRERGSASGV